MRSTIPTALRHQLYTGSMLTAKRLCGGIQNIVADISRSSKFIAIPQTRLRRPQQTTGETMLCYLRASQKYAELVDIVDSNNERCGFSVR